MQTFVFETAVTAKTAIVHNGGEINGNTAMLRTMDVFQPDGTFEAVPVISGNGFRGKMRRVSGKRTLDLLGDGEKPHAVKVDVFQFLFSGGALTGGTNADDVDAFKQMRETLPHVSLFGGARGNAILPGKMKWGQLIPIGKETAHIIPSGFHFSNMPSVHEYRQMEMYTRKESSGEPEFEPYIEGEKGETTQMIYHVESLKAGTPFYWKIILEDATESEFDYFRSVIDRFKKTPFVGGKSGTGYGQIEIGEGKWKKIELKNDTLEIKEGRSGDVFEDFVKKNGDKVRGFLKMI